MPPKLKGILYTFASAAFLSVTFIASKQALKELPSLGFTPIWFAIASTWGFGYYTLQTEKISWTQLKPYLPALIALGLSSSMANFFFFTGVKLGDPTIVAFFSRSETIFSLLLGVLLLKEKLTPWQWLGAAIAIAGAGIMTYKGGAIIWTVLALTVTANFFNAFTSYIAKRNVANVPPVVLGIARTVVLMLALGAISFATGNLRIPSPRAFAWIVGGSFFGPFLSFVLFYKGLKTMDIGQAAIIRATQPLFVAVYSLLLFGTTIGSLQFAGGLIILTGVVLMLSGRANEGLSMSNPLLAYFKRKRKNQ
jgi:uncharacterized membrane protein